MDEIEAAIADNNYHVSNLRLDDERVIVMKQGPEDLAKEAGRKAWLEWSTGILGEVTGSWGRIRTLISPSNDYDKWIKLVAKVMGVEASCRDRTVQAVARHISYKKSLEILEEYKERPEGNEDTNSQASVVGQTGNEQESKDEEENWHTLITR